MTPLGRASTTPSDQKQRPEEIEDQRHCGHGGESNAVAGDGVSGVMNVQGDERNRDADR